MNYAKYLITPLLMTIVTGYTMAGGLWMWAGFLFLVFVIVGGDALSYDDLSEPEFGHIWLLNIILYFTIPVLLLMLFVTAWMSGSEGHDLFGAGAAVYRYTGFDPFAARAATGWYHLAGAILGTGLAVAGYGTNVAHEFTHRTSDPAAMIAGRWLLAMSCNSDFSIEHVYGHHQFIGTKRDPATAYRGENVYSFILRSTVYGHISAWNLEANRLRKKGLHILSFRNRMLTGYAMSIAYAAFFYAAAGWPGVFVFFAQAAWAKVILEIVNYMEHYGLVRAEGEPVLPRHSWNTNKYLSSLILYSLTRHSAHHEKGDLPFWKLKPYTAAPTMPFGYLTTIIICLVPPLWKNVMAPKLAEWDERYASPMEKQILRDSERAAA